MSGGVQIDGAFARVRKSALELLLRARVRFRLMVFKSLFIAFHVHLEAAFGGELFRHLDGEAVSVVKAEGGLAVQGVALNIFEDLFHLLDPVFQRFGEFFLFLGDLGNYLFAVKLELAVNALVFFDIHGSYLREQGAVDVDRAGKADRPAQQTAQNVALIHVRRDDALFVADEEGGGAHMVGDDAHGARHALVFSVLFAAQLFELFDDVGEKVGLIDGLIAVEHAQGAFKSHARVHVLLAQGSIAAVGMAVKFHEDVVPDLHPLAAVFGGGRVALDLFARVHEDFRVAAARSRGGGYPPIMLFGQIKDPVLGNAVALPFACRNFVARAVLVARKDGHGEFFARDTEHFRQKFIAERDGFFLEIVAQRPITQHLEKGAVRGIAHLVDVARAHAFLNVGQALARGVLLSQEIGDEGVHSRRGEEHGGVVFGNERRRGDHGVSLRSEKLQILFSQFVRFHSDNIIYRVFAFGKCFKPSKRYFFIKNARLHTTKLCSITKKRQMPSRANSPSTATCCAWTSPWAAGLRRSFISTASWTR